MRRIGIIIVISALFVSLGSAQETATKNSPNLIDGSPGTSQSVNNDHPFNLTGSGTTNYIPLWTSPSNLTSSVIYQTSGQNVGIGTTTPAAKLDVNGNINTGATYQIGGSTVLSIGSTADQNLFLGVGAGSNHMGTDNTFSGYQAGFSDFAGYNAFFGAQAGYSNTSGYYNTFIGYQAGYKTTIGSPNTFVGTGAGYGNMSGQNNVFVGYAAGANSDSVANTFMGSQSGFWNTGGNYNAFFGQSAGYSNTTGFSNAFFGSDAGSHNTTGVFNVFLGDGAGMSNDNGSGNVFAGHDAGFDNSSGVSNVYLGYAAGNNNMTGSNNIAVGNSAGFYSTGSNNVYIANWGSAAESSTIRIGTQGTGQGQQNITYIAGIYGSTASGGVPVYINSNGQLGTSGSSRRFKEQIRDMGDSSSSLVKLRPVTFLYKPEYDQGERTLQYGLIAEEVAKVYPELVAYDNGGQPYTVRYQYITTMLLNEVQKQYHRADAQADVIKAQEQKIDELELRLSRLERLIPETVAQK